MKYAIEEVENGFKLTYWEWPDKDLPKKQEFVFEYKPNFENSIVLAFDRLIARLRQLVIL